MVSCVVSLEVKYFLHIVVHPSIPRYTLVVLRWLLAQRKVGRAICRIGILQIVQPTAK